MPENQRCLFKIGIFYETAVTQKTMKINTEYRCYVIASTFKKRIKHPPGHAPCDSYKISDRRKSDQWIPAVFFCFIGKFSSGELLIEKGPARRRAQQVNDV